MLDLRRPIYKQTAAYGHFGRNDLNLPWERLDKVEELKKLTDIEFIELDATLVKDDEAFEKEVKRCLDLEETCIKAGKTGCCYTTRALITMRVNISQ